MHCTCIFTGTLIQFIPQQEAYTARGVLLFFMHSNLHPQSNIWLAKQLFL